MRAPSADAIALITAPHHLTRQVTMDRATPQGAVLVDAAKRRKQVLDQAHEAGILERTRYEELLAEDEQQGTKAGLVVAGSRMVGGQLVVDHTGQWKVAVTGFPSEKEAMKASKMVEHGGNEGEWAWNQQGSRKVKRCNMHEDCPVMLRAKQHANGKWSLDVTDLSHSTVPKSHRHARAPFTFAEEKKLVEGVNHGQKAASLRDEALLSGIDSGSHKKKEKGGLTGSQDAHDT